MSNGVKINLFRLFVLWLFPLSCFWLSLLLAFFPPVVGSSALFLLCLPSLKRCLPFTSYLRGISILRGFCC
nr:MAG TPA: hypothetical protein [Caudoviricetes sp.]